MKKITFETIFKKVIRSLNNRKVRYLVIGGLAVGAHGYPRATKNIDVWIEPDYEKFANIFKNFKKMKFVPVMHKKPRKFFDSGRKHIIFLAYGVDIDIWLRPQKVRFDFAWTRRKRLDYMGIPCYVISSSDLIKLKKISGRAQDLVDIQMLKKVKR